MTPRQYISQVARFLCVGGIGVIMYFIVLYVCTDILLFPYIISAVFASFINIGVNFVLHKFWTFQDGNLRKTGKQALGYSILAIGLFFANLIFLYLLVEWTHLWYMAAQVIVTIVLTVVSYLVSRRIFSV